MAKRIDIKEFYKKAPEELLYHMSVQSLLDLKAVNGQITLDDLITAYNMSTFSKVVLFYGHIAYIVFGIPSDSKGQLNLYIYATTECYSKMAMTKESLFNVINLLKNYKVCSIIYKGNKKLQSLLRVNGFKFDKNICFGRENRTFCLFVKE